MAKEVKNKKEIGKDNKNFAKEFKAELKKVSWPTLKQLVNNTVAVVVIVLITATIVFLLDIVFETINKYGVEKLKSIVTSNSENIIENENQVENTIKEENNINENEETNTVTEEETNTVNEFENTVE